MASAFAGTGNALTAKDINTDALKALFAGQRLTAGSSGFLADSYVKDQSSLDGIINYESVLLGLNAGGKLSESLDLIHTYFVLDISGSMQGDRLNGVKTTFANLTGADQSITGQFARFRAREDITIVTFNGTVQDTRDFTINDPTPGSADLKQVLNFVDGLQASDGTAIYDGLIHAYNLAGPAKSVDPNRFYSVVLMTDGQNNAGNDATQFQNWYRSASPEIQSIKCFAVIFGEASPQELNDVAKLTGGRTFDARSVSLAIVFKEIRGYQ